MLAQPIHADDRGPRCPVLKNTALNTKVNHGYLIVLIVPNFLYIFSKRISFEKAGKIRWDIIAF